MFNNSEIISVDEIFENEELVVMHTVCGDDYFKFVKTDIGIKDSSGDISKIITVNAKPYSE